MIRLLFLSLISGVASAALVESDVIYQDGDAELEGFHVYDDEVNGERPGILIIHQWMGLSDYEKGRARQLAELGYNVFAADIYGKGIRPDSTKEAGKQAGTYKSDRELFRSRVTAGLKVLQGHELTKTGNLASIGYCFGGTGVLELARSGAEIQGVVSFHGGIGPDRGMEARVGRIPAKILVLHGADDPFVSAKEIDAFKTEMNEAKANWQMNSYSGAVHAFTQPQAGDDNSKGAAYNEQADERSWQAMKRFFNEIFDQ